MTAVAVPFTTTLTADDFGSMARFAGCHIIFAQRRIFARVAASLPPTCIVIFEDEFEGAVENFELPWRVDAGVFDDSCDAAIMFTSGTTAKPRADRITHRNIQANTGSIIQYLDLYASNRMMTILQFYYCFATSLLHTHLKVGGSLVLSNSFLYPETVLDQIEATQCTGFAGVPSTYQALLRNSTFSKRQIRSLNKIHQAGGKLQDVLIQELIAAMP